jgi:hypothetical protein
MKDYVVAAKVWDVQLKLQPFTDEDLIVKAFKAGKCDAVAISGIRANEFNDFVGSLAAVGGLTDVASTKLALTLMANPKLASDMVNGDYEVAGVTALGTIYIMVKDRSYNTLAKMAGKKIGVLDSDKADLTLVDRVGATAVPLPLAVLAPQFNKGEVDAIPLLPLMFKPFELDKGLGTKGAIIRYPLLQFTGDIIIRQNLFPKGYGQKSRNWFSSRVDQEMALARRLEADIPDKYWQDIPNADKIANSKVLSLARTSLVNRKLLNKKMVNILDRIRCVQNPTNVECKAVKDL